MELPQLIFFHPLKMSEEEKSEEGVDWKSRRSSCPKRLALEQLYYWPWGCVLLVHDCLSAAANFVLSALILSFAGSYVFFATEGIVQDLFWIILAYKYSLVWNRGLFFIGIGRDYGK